MLCQNRAEDEIRNLRKNFKYDKACSLGEEYIRFFPKSNAIKEEVYISHLLNRNFYQANVWIKKINLEHDPEYISKNIKSRLYNNKILIEKSLLSSIAMIKIVINGNKPIDQVQDIIRKTWSLCKDKDFVHAWIIQTENVSEITNFVFEENMPMNVFDFDCDVLDFYQTPYILYVDDEPEQPFKVSTLLSILEQEILISHVGLQSKNFQDINDGIPKIFFSHHLLFKKILENSCENGYSLAFMDTYEVKIFQTLIPPKYKCFYINLERRQDRMKHVKKLLQIPNIPFLHRFDAIDGTALQPTPRLQALCGNGNYAMKEGVIGCALSHLQLYTMLVEDDVVDGYVIFEDDVEANANFAHQLEQVLTITKERKNGIVFLSSVPLQCQRTINSQYRHKGILNRSPHHWYEIAGGTGCYYITKETAKQVLNHIDQQGLYSPIDMILMFNTLCDFNPSFCLPPIVTQYGIDDKSDVQINFNHPSHLLSSVKPSNYKIFGPNNKPDFIEDIDVEIS